MAETPDNFVKNIKNLTSYYVYNKERSSPPEKEEVEEEVKPSHKYFVSKNASKPSDSFMKKLKRLSDYVILRENENYLLIGTSIILQEHKPLMGNIFQPREFNIQSTQRYICFLISFTPNTDLLEEFSQVPTIFMNTHDRMRSEAEIKNILDNFIKK